MCGICGVFSFAPTDGREISESVWRMTEMMQRRGPDDWGLWSDGDVCSLGFRRLSILDLTPTANQPMRTADGRFALVYNGELYNYRELRRDLESEGVSFSSSGDTQVVLNALARWGIAALEQFNGMFALGFYDRAERTLLLARDHAGIKPLYYLRSPRGIVFASQYDQILSHPWSRDLRFSPPAVAMYLRLGYIPAPDAVLENTHLLEPGAWLRVDREGRLERGRYFAFPRRTTPELTGEEADEAVDAAVTAAVRRQLVSDVPLGVFLSGGIDSPLVAAKMCALTNGSVQAFTLGTNGDPLDESPDAIAYAREMGLEHHVEHVSPERGLEILEDAVAACGEPFADYSILPTLLICRRARSDVKVMLSGDGGDELFWGYSERFGSVIDWADAYRRPRWWRDARWGMKKVLDIGKGHWNLRWSSIGEWYRAKHSRVPENWLRRIFPDLPEWPASSDLFAYRGSGKDRTADWLRWNEFVGHLTMVLLKVDRASMHSSLEVRVPLLDREVIDVATKVEWRSCLDRKAKLGKLPLRHALSRYLRHQTQAKRGFSIPLSDWFRGPLRPIFEETLLRRDELFGFPMVGRALRELYEEHLSGRVDRAWALWVLLSGAFWEDRHYRSRGRFAAESLAAERRASPSLRGGSARL